jgi:hypothetical protein
MIKTFNGAWALINTNIKYETFSSNNKKHIKVIVIKVIIYYHRKKCVIASFIYVLKE